MTDLSIPTQELEPTAQRLLVDTIRLEPHGSGKRQRLLAFLWLHFAHKRGIKPWELKDTTTQAHRIVRNDWEPAAAKVTGLPSSIIRDQVRDVAALAAKLHTQALEERSAAAGGQAVPLF